MFTHQTTYRVRYADTDKMGYMYYGHYARLYEIGRVEMMRSIGFTYQQMEDVHKVMMPVVEMEVKYLKPAYYDDLLTINTSIKTLPERIMEAHVEVISEKGQIINRGMVKLMFVSTIEKKVVNAPDLLLDQIKTYFEQS